MKTSHVTTVFLVGLAGLACFFAPSPPRLVEQVANAEEPPAVASAWVLATVLDETRTGSLFDTWTTYKLQTTKSFTDRSVGRSSLRIPTVGGTFALEVRGGNFANGYRSRSSNFTLLERGNTYLIRVCASPRGPVFTECGGPGITVARLIDDDAEAAHPYFTVASSRAVIGWAAHGPEATDSLVPQSAREQLAACVEAAPEAIQIA